jgi:hypothetical protein
VEYQTQLRRLERLRRRLELAKREYQAASFMSLQDHEIAHIWGLPASTLVARKVKYLPQYLQGLQIALDRTVPAGQVAGHLDLWKATFETLSQRPIERSVASYDGLEGSESALIEKLTALAAGTLPEEAENRFWLSLAQESVHAGEYGSKIRSVFGLQRLVSILNDMDGSPEALEEELLALVAPSSKTSAGPLEEPKPSSVQLGEMGEHVLRSLIGEDRA